MIITENTKTITKEEAGGKGYNLFQLSKNGFPVPRFVIIPAQTFTKFKVNNGLDRKIDEFLVLLKQKNSVNDINKISTKIQNLIKAAHISDEISLDIKEAYGIIHANFLAVRSSAADEDSNQYSFAGQFESFLGIKTEEEALLAIKRCWMSLYSSRCLSYRVQNELSLGSQTINIAVILQEMIKGEVSGIMFTKDPITQNSSHIVINSVYGLGDKLAAGEINADTFSFDKKTLRLLTKKTEAKNNETLTLDESKSLAKIARSIEDFYQSPQDIEWTIKNKKIYILQSRPITTNSKDEYLNVWDNSNIVESYGGLTLPLTFTFARYVYHQVYVQFCEVLFVPKKEIRKMDYFLKNMLGLFYGRVYYNLLNWYKLTSIIPGYRFNREFMETMMGTKKSLESEIADRIRPPISRSKFVQTLTGFKFLYYHFVIQSKVNEFLTYFNKTYQKYRRLDYSKMQPHEILSIYYELENTLLLEWKAPIINDYLCMVHFGILKKLSNRWLKNLSDSIQNDLLCGEGNIESIAPTRELIKIAQYIQENPSMKKTLLETSPEKCMDIIKDSDNRELKQKIDRYIDLYGYRCMNEMKLEEKDLYQDPSFLFICIKNYLQNEKIITENYGEREKEIRIRAEEKVRSKLNPVKLAIYFWSLKHARKAVKNRENTRFCRTRIYGVVRSWFYNIGKDFASRNIIEKPEDIFYLELNELLGSLEGTLTIQNLKPLIKLRKDRYEEYKLIEPASRFVTRGPVYWNNNHAISDNISSNSSHSNHIMKGLGCSPWNIQGVVRIVKRPEDAEKLKGEILVTTRTDPGWIPLYPSISGLIVERGSLLSHSAIVAREMGIPTIVSLTEATQKLTSGMKIQMDGQTGEVKIL